MTDRLAIPPGGAIDLVALGSLVIRLNIGFAPFRKAHECANHVTGAEYNVAANLGDCFGCGPRSPRRWSATRSATSSPSVFGPPGDPVLSPFRPRRGRRPERRDRLLGPGGRGPQAGRLLDTLMSSSLMCAATV